MKIGLWSITKRCAAAIADSAKCDLLPAFQAIASTISGAWHNSRIPDVRRLLVSSTVSFMFNHASLEPL
jgi:hypothetical protein